ncbi:uncharacterized protein At5g23160-like [Hibiscus syriacus]|uniref:uncharacterized protein At5g23160-like n=1 Tax=Hibiscus syriacus TaxID=106335 RepID=UPI001924444C|nr:uncharacterized protein At5g23160-like [Hibiscus syriacus]
MAQPHQTNPRIGCFVFYMKKKSQQNNTRSLYWARFRLISRNSSTKAVPVNNKDKTGADRSKTKKKPDSTERLPSTNHFARETLKEVLLLENKEFVEKFEPVMGISIIMVTLIIMAIWGRVCAILCTSACLYIFPRFRTRSIGNESTTPNADDLHLSSEEYKKKVVLEGLLWRNRPFTL